MPPRSSQSSPSSASPNGAELALGEFFHASQLGGGGPTADLVVVSQRTGKRTTWSGIRRKGWPVSIPSVSWTPDGRSVVYLLQWCSLGLNGSDTCVLNGKQYAQVWSLNAARTAARWPRTDACCWPSPPASPLSSRRSTPAAPGRSS